MSDAVRAYNFCSKFFPVTRTEWQKGLCQLRDGEVIAAVLYDECNGSNLWMHVAGEPGRRWLTRSFLHWAFHYPFEQVGVKRISAWVEANNMDSRNFCEHVGFVREATLKYAGRDGVDVYIYTMFREACRYA